MLLHFILIVIGFLFALLSYESQFIGKVQSKARNHTGAGTKLSIQFPELQ
jgi:hypothetical protein